MALPKLNLRDLFWLVVVVGMGLGWWIDRNSTYWYVKKAEKTAAQAEMRAQAAEVSLLEAGESHKRLLENLQQREVETGVD